MTQFLTWLPALWPIALIFVILGATWWAYR
jgi:hypothetical protein